MYTRCRQKSLLLTSHRHQTLGVLPLCGVVNIVIRNYLLSVVPPNGFRRFRAQDGYLYSCAAYHIRCTLCKYFWNFQVFSEHPPPSHFSLVACAYDPQGFEISFFFRCMVKQKTTILWSIAPAPLCVVLWPRLVQLDVRGSV